MDKEREDTPQIGPSESPRKIKDDRGVYSRTYTASDLEPKITQKGEQLVKLDFIQKEEEVKLEESYD